ncbi:uncharacterized protein E0L32_004556 [Thyridium curvatum]|uniref:Major facilitator superfamily (MFS) profile domain-containing protein n=1 Tax=Thyridium curvatum TaxID=1093900 RepID=A0A507BCZ8_9PEZI|nr:uncharacterized protein E0L32_004556 [Thyridium curvatum]TPX15279.1 hypothetical protein E0L32_004556 [Thyridium curvatum]
MEVEQDKSSDIGQGATYEVMKEPSAPRTEYEEYLELSRVFTGVRLKKLLWKVDWHVLPQLIIIYLMSYVDRTNVGNAKLFGALPDLRLSGQDWNTALSIFFVTYAFGGVPSNIGLKRFGPKIWLPALLLSVSLILIFSSLQQNRAGWMAFRVLLGWFEAGVFPGCSFVLTMWYSPAEVHSRMTIFYCGASAAGAFSGLLAYGIGHLDHTWGFRGWRFIYCIEGLFSVLLALGAFFLLNDTPAKVTKWLTPEEQRFLVLRSRYSAGGETGIAEKEEFSWKSAKDAFKSFHIYAIAAMEFTLCVTVYGYSFILPTVINNLGYSAANAQAMTVPPYIFASIVTVFSGWCADRYKQRMLSVLLPNLLAVTGFVIMMVTVRYPHLTGVTLLGVFFATAGLYPVSPNVTAWIALNLSGSMKRAVGIGAMISFSQLGGIVGSNIYIAEQAPTYPVGFGISLGMLFVFGVVWPIIYYFILKRINAKRAAIPAEEVHAKYTDQELSEMGDRSPLFSTLLTSNMSTNSPTVPEIRRGEKPCRNCRAAQVDCTYADHERVLTVPESYLRSLEADRDRRRWDTRSPQSAPHAIQDADAGVSSSDTRNVNANHQTIENSAPEAFLAKVNQLRQSTTFSAISDPSLGDNLDSANGGGSSKAVTVPNAYEYFRLSFDTSHTPISLSLPPYPYAVHLLDQFDIYLAHDYHWFLCKTFKKRLERTYRQLNSPESKDRLWLCLLLIVFALGETFVNYHTPVIHIDSNASSASHMEDRNEDSSSPTALPGTSFFEQALVLLKLPYEEPSIEYVELLNLATFYSYSLNRKKTAYMYAGMSVRVCNLLRIHQPAPQTFSGVEQEHRKRLCWTAYCLDKMTSSELGMIPSFQPGQIKLEYPSSEQLRPEEACEFHEADFLRARIQLTFMKAEADVFIDMWQSIRDDVSDIQRRVRPILLKLEQWFRDDLPSYMSFDCESGLPEAMVQMPNMRSLCSFYLRCQQCFILLLRPLFLKQITYIVSDDVDSAAQDENLRDFSNTCLRAARTNLSILIGLWHLDRIAKFGFWDSVHLFSSLTIFSLAMSVNRRRPGSFDEKDVDFMTYSTAKDLLRDMVKTGNLASKGHEKMLLDVEALGEVLGAMQTDGSDFVMEQYDMDNWMAQVLSMDSITMF